MAEVIRDVVVRITIDQVEAKLKTPNFASAAGQAKEMAAAIDGLSGKIDKLIDLMLKHLQVEKEAESAAKTSREEFRKSEEAKKAAAEEAKKHAEALKQEAESQKRLADAANKATAANAKLRDLQLQVGEIFKSSVGGVMNLARAYAYLSAASEEDTEQALKTIANIEGVVRAGMGAIDVLTAIAKSYKLLQEAAVAAEAANLALAASNTAVATTGAAAAAAGAAGGAARATGGAGAVTAGSALGTLAATGIGAFLIAGAKLVALAAIFTEVIDRLAGNGGILEVMAERSAASKSEETTARRQEGLQRNRSVLSAREQAAQREGEFLARGQSLEISGQQAALDAALQRAPDARGKLNALNQSLGAASQAAALASDQATGIQQAQERAKHERGIAEVFAEQVSAFDRAVVAQQRVVDLERQRLPILQEIRAGLSDEISKNQTLLEKAQAQLEIEQNRGRSAAARFARLSQDEQTRLKDISGRRQAGQEVSADDVAFLEKTGFGTDLAERFRVQQAQQAGFGGLLSEISGVDNVQQAALKQEIENRKNAAEKLRLQLEENADQIEQESELLLAAQQRLFDAQMKALERLRASVVANEARANEFDANN